MATEIVWPFADVTWQIGPLSYSRATQYAELRTRRGRQMLRIGTNGSSTVNLSVVLSDVQLADFDGWIQHTLAGGGKWFRAPVKLSGIRQERELRLLNIGEPVQAIGLSGKWTVPCTAETRVGSAPAVEVFSGYLNPNPLIIG